MTIKTVSLPLFQDADYHYVIPLENVAYQLRFYYNERMSQWMVDLSLADGTPLVMGEALTRAYPLFFDYEIPGLTGVFLLDLIGPDMNETRGNPFEIWNYFNLVYIYDDGNDE